MKSEADQRPVSERQKRLHCLKVSCLGPAGSYSELAAKQFCGEEYAVVLCRSFPEVVSKLVSGETDYAILPIENSIQGGVLQNLDLLEQSEIFAIEEIVLPIDHRLVTKGRIPFGQIERIYSHEQAIGQCSEFLEAHFPNAQRVFTQSTAECLGRLDERSAGIVGAHAGGEGLVLSQGNIANDTHNFTRFMLLRRRGEMPPCSGKVFFCAVCEHKPGSLLELLQIFARHGLNLTRIESRPIRGVFGQYRFFIEFAGDIGSAPVRETLDEAGKLCVQFRILGAYHEKPDSRASG